MSAHPPAPSQALLPIRWAGSARSRLPGAHGTSLRRARLAASSFRRALSGAIACVVAAFALPATSRAAGLFEANHPQVQQGTDLYGKGDYEGALKAYEQAQRELPDSPELQYNLGDVYMKLKRPDDAKRAYEAALKKAPDALKARDYFNLGNALVELDAKEDAVAAYRQALKVDPHHEPARRNLEILLRKKSEQQKNNPVPGDGGLPDGGRDAGAPDSGGQDGGQSKDKPDAGSENDGGSDGGGGGDGGASDSGGSDGGADGGSGDGGGQADGGSGGDGGRQDGGGDGGSPDQDENQDPPDGGSQDAGEQDGGTPPPSQPPEKPKNLDKQEAERLLDAIRRNEKQFLMQQHKRKQRVRPEKDW